ncbi:DUF262 domain-containing protein [Clostridium butyricum]|nr:DUF262 domain-containing protein [Clostridium butyricum]KHD14001.1 hypothetical protein OA81_17920 [Clostridium butyricum]
MQNNKMIPIKKMIEECFNKQYIYIPLLQRNYKWKKESTESDNSPSAKKLVNNLWSSYCNKIPTYTMGMITLYNENNEKLQIIDGQQRIITLTLLLKALDAEKDYFKFYFERDEGVDECSLKRSDYISLIYLDNIDDSFMYTDLIRFKENFKVIKETLEERNYKESDKEGFINYILENVNILFHLTDVEPTDEFLNINKNKTPFVISDYVKANMIMDINEKEESCDSRKKILDLFKELSAYLFIDEYMDIWELISQGYECKLNENRLKILFCDRYDNNSIIGYEYENEYKRLLYYKNIIKSLIDDINKKNWNSFNGFNCLREISNNNGINKLKFF